MFTDTGQDWMRGTCTAGHGEITVLCKRSEEEICRNQWILVNFDDQMAKQGDKSKQNFVAWRNFVPGWMKFRVIKTKFCFFEAKFRFSETKYCFVERKFRTRLGRELFNWADMSFSIRVRIVYESWSPFLVSSIKSSVQKTSSLTHRL